MPAGAGIGERARDPLGLEAGEFHGQRFALGRGIKKALPAVAFALLLQHVALIHQLLQHPAERLFGDVEDIQQVGDLDAGMAGHEMHDPMMRAAESEFRKRLIGIADEIAIGEEQQFDQIPDRLAGGPGRSPVPASRDGREVV